MLNTLSKQSISSCHVFSGFATKSDLVVGLINVGVTAAIGLLVALMNSVGFYTGNSKKRGFNAVISLLGAFVLFCMVFDFENLLAYLTTAYFIAAVQLGILFERGNIRRGEWWLLGLSLAYLAGFVLMIVG